MLPSEFVYIGIFVQIIVGSGYLYDTLRGKTKPNRVTWFLWALAPLIAFSAMAAQGVGTEALSTLAIGVLPLVVLAASFVNKKAIWEIEKFDYICASISIMGLILWQLSDEPNIAIAMSIVADFAAALPTIKKSYFNPETESASAFIAGTINASFALLTITEWKFENFGFQLYWLIVSTLIATLIVKGKITKRVL